MSVIDTMFTLLSNDAELRGLLASHELANDFPAIYDRWVVEDVPMPYMVLTWDFARGDSLGKSDSVMICDIFTTGNSSRQAELIVTRLKELLEHNVLMSENGPIRSHYVRDGDIPEDVPNIVHWSIEFQVIYWDQQLINYINLSNR